MATEGTADRPLALVEVAHLSDTGRIRHHNEDRSLASPRVLVVADGMGGAKAGEVAAQMAVDAVGRLVGPVHEGDVRGAVERANRAIRRVASDDPDKSGMGTTLTAAMLDDGRLDVVHVGDSRAYLWRDGALRQVTEDHSVVAELVRRGSITREEAETHPHRNVITRALGAEEAVVADVVQVGLEDGDVVLLCSDGLSSYVPESAIAEVLAQAATLDAAAKGLVNLANGAGGADNVTVVLARVAREEDRTGDTAEAPAPAAGDADRDGDTATAPAGEMRVLGGVHGHAGRPDGATTRPPKVLEPVRRRRSRVIPIVAGAVVLLIVAGGAVAWVSSRSYGLEEGPDGTVQVTNGLDWGLFGQSLSRTWQETGVDAGTVRAVEPQALSTAVHGQGEAVALAARLAWTYGVPQPPALEAPAQPARSPAPSRAESTPGTTTAP
ncbi:MAG TPA: Stp1/IreP family PP2C-type Ser/Thr phosphatase [Miltoncostaeaceae bacterium]|nr:Stp1/IreP family PP2C-type Ser/Thr phosphatase [Miltoncostaeaceae bacterium]